MKKKINIIFEWWHDEIEEISPEHQTELEERAMEKIYQCLRDGYTSGQLFENIYEGGLVNDFVRYQGHWEMKMETC